MVVIAQGNMLTVIEVAEKMRVSVFTVYRWIRDGDLKAVRIKRNLRIEEEALQQFIDRNRTE